MEWFIKASRRTMPPLWGRDVLPLCFRMVSRFPQNGFVRPPLRSRFGGFWGRFSQPGASDTIFRLGRPLDVAPDPACRDHEKQRPSIVVIAVDFAAASVWVTACGATSTTV